jgi:hypothetical protein
MPYSLVTIDKRNTLEYLLQQLSTRRMALDGLFEATVINPSSIRPIFLTIRPIQHIVSYFTLDGPLCKSTRPMLLQGANAGRFDRGALGPGPGPKKATPAISPPMKQTKNSSGAAVCHTIGISPCTRRTIKHSPC